jgi:hypothetical protein
MSWYTVDSTEEENAVREVILIMTEAWSRGGRGGISLLARLLLSYSYISSRTF